ncbi:hypothetical protein BD324DRAFT_641773 [Kockovaella imperatae]|uniref:non-specific serine/threonine protein kinase n=1 Tax=Kockovaella imperatae TaxID=4999 RepID=A0A1Y1UKC4_9TREE|nr:hypothetical protein BD324DRAFT_641773 [Kockovaella imperatae]ORX37575.1 hypothetical protein BD324DRAFT_641773 [Kockovaella imperatae]
MAPDIHSAGTGTPRKDAAESSSGTGTPHRHHRDRIGPYVVDGEIGRGSFATVFKGHRSKSRVPIAIKAVSRQKLTTKLLENLESEINILKAINHRNIVGMEDCFKSDTHIYLVMEFCSGSDLSIYIKNRGRLPTLDFVPRGAGPNAEKIFWPHPAAGGIDERVIRCFLGQLALALQFLRSQDLVHRDIKPQNLLMQPATPEELAEGHPLGIPVLKVADFGFARILPAAAMAETLCGSPLYMAPEILRYEKYDAKADLWSVGAVLFEMSVGRPPFRANNHVELLRRIEKGEDRIKFPDESSKAQNPPEGETPQTSPVPDDIKALIRGLLKRQPAMRMGFEDFFACGVWDGHMTESKITEDGSEGMSYDTSTESSALAASDRVREMLESEQAAIDARPVPTHAPQPLSTDKAMNPQPAPRPQAQPQSAQPPQQIRPPFAQLASVSNQRPRVPRQTEPKYYVSDERGVERETATPVPTPPTSASPLPIISGVPATGPPITNRRVSPRENREISSVEDPQPLTPSSNVVTAPIPRRVVGEGSPLAATPPITFVTGKDESALEGEDSVVGREYVVVEKRTVEVNALADELDRASKKPEGTMIRRQSSRTSIVTRPVSSFKPSSTSPHAAPVPLSTTPQHAALTHVSQSPPFSLSSTPPFAVPPFARQPSGPPQGTIISPAISRSPSVNHSLPSSSSANHGISFPPTQLFEQSRYGTSPSSLQTGALARALTNTAMRLIGTSANAAGNVIARATASKRRPTITRTGDLDAEEDDLLRSVEDCARKAFVLFELADSRLLTWQSLANLPSSSSSAKPRRKSSSSSINSEVAVLRKQEIAAGEGVVLYCKALTFIVQGTNRIQRYWERRAKNGAYETSSELNEMVQWLRARFNECYEKAEWAKSKCAEELPFVDRLSHDKSRDMSRLAAQAELNGDFVSAESGYESSLWLLQALADNLMYDDGEQLRPEDRASIEKLSGIIRARLESLRKKMADAGVPSRT